MTEGDRQEAARAAVQGLMRADKVKALAVAVVLASSSLAGCSSLPQNQPCPGQSDTIPCVQPSGNESGWLAPPRWPAREGSPGGPQGVHLASNDDFVANPQYTQLRAGQTDGNGGGGGVFYGGGHYYGGVGGVAGGEGAGG